MANYNINSGNLTSLGTDGADNFYFRSGGAPNVVVNALAGNDSVYIQSAQSAEEGALDGLFLSLQGGADSLLLSADSWTGPATSSTIRAGAGGDSLTLNADFVQLSGYQVFLGDGSDSLAATLSAVQTTTFNAGSGADTVTITAESVESGAALLGSGADQLNLVASVRSQSQLFELGGGSDNGNFDVAYASAVTIREVRVTIKLLFRVEQMLLPLSF